jgi:hypothetical protein
VNEQNVQTILLVIITAILVIGLVQGRMRT